MILADEEPGSRVRTTLQIIEEVGIPAAILLIVFVGAAFFLRFLIWQKWPKEVEDARKDAAQAREELKAERAAMEMIRHQVREEYLTGLKDARLHFEKMLEALEKREDDRTARLVTVVEQLAAVIKGKRYGDGD